MTTTVERSIEVGAPLRAVYNQWSRFEDFPRFMEGVREVRRTDDTHLHWHAQIAGRDKRWEALITEQVPDQRIAWQSISGAESSARVELEPLGESRTRVSVTVGYGPEGVLENVGDVLGLTARRVEGDLARFKRLVETGRASTRARLGAAWDEPVAVLRRMSEQLDRVFETVVGTRVLRPRAQAEAPGAWMPQVEISQRGQEYLVRVDLPGVAREDVEIEIDEGLLVVRGERRSSTRGEAGVLRSECSYGRFYRAVPLPDGAKAEAARALMRDGVLEITLPAPQRQQPRRLEIGEASAASDSQAHRTQAEPANESPRPDAEQDRRQSERRDWQSEGRLGM